MNYCICTGCMGKAREYSRWTLPTIKNYADKIDVDYFEINDYNRKFSKHLPTYEKYQIEELLNKYDRVLWIDCDVVVHPRSTNLFDEVPYNKMGVMWDGKNQTQEGTKGRLRKEIRKIQEGLGDIGWSRGYFNAGVMLFSECHKNIFEGGFEWVLDKKVWRWNDQSLLNWMRFKLDIPVYSLDFKWNSMNNKCDWDYLVKKSYFAHFSGRKQKKRMCDFINILNLYHQEIVL